MPCPHPCHAQDARAKGLLRCSSGPSIRAVCNGPMMQPRSLSFAETEIELHSSSRSSPRGGVLQGDVNHKLQTCHSGIQQSRKSYKPSHSLYNFLSSFKSACQILFFFLTLTIRCSITTG